MIGVPLGFIAALQPGGMIDTVSMVVAVSGLSIAEILARPAADVSVRPEARMVAEFRLWRWLAANLVLPAVTLGVSPLALLARTTRAAVLEIMNADFVRTARSKGMSETRVVQWHVMRNALVIVLTTIGLQFGALMGQAVVVEKLFSWPGIGSLLVDSVFARDIPAVQGCILLIVLFFLRRQHAGRSALRDDRSAHQVHLRGAMKLGANLMIGGALFAHGDLRRPARAMAGAYRSGDGCQPDDCGRAAGPEFWFGTDAQGRDIYSRVAATARASR